METVLGLVVASAVSFLFLLKSPLHPWINGTILTDSSVFKTVAMMMDKGKMPYVDSFDHKGPLVYIINWAGNQISSYRGVWVIEFVFMITMLWFLYKTARIVTGRLQSLIAVLVSISLLFSYFDAGNLVEEYAMAFIAVAQYVFVDYFIHDRINIIRLLACGFGFGAVLMLRPNMIALWVVMCIFVLIGIIKDKNYARLGGIFIMVYGWGSYSDYTNPDLVGGQRGGWSVPLRLYLF